MISVLHKNENGTFRVHRHSDGAQFDIHPAGMPHLADGGMVTQPTPAVVGEAGPEMVIPAPAPDGGMPESGAVIPPSMGVPPGQGVPAGPGAVDAGVAPPSVLQPGTPGSNWLPDQALPTAPGLPAGTVAPAGVEMPPGGQTTLDMLGKMAKGGAGSEKGTSGTLGKGKGGGGKPNAIDAEEQRSVDLGMKGAETLAAAKGAEGDKEAEILHSAAAGTAQFQQQQQQMAQQKAAYAADQQQKFQAVNDQIMNTKIDPGHLWHSMDTGGQILASIGLIMGGIGGAFNGGRNMALETLNQAIDRDINAQKSNFEAKRAGLAGMQSIYGMHMQALGDQSAALAAAHETSLEIANQQIKQAMATAKSPEALAALQSTQAELLHQQAAFTQQRQTATLANANAYEELTQRRMQNQQTRDLMSANREFYGTGELPTDSYKRQLIIQQAAAGERIAGDRGIATNRKVTPEDQKQIQISDTVRQHLAYLNNVAKSGISIKGNARAQTILATLGPLYANAIGLKAAESPKTQAALQDLLDNPDDWFKKPGRYEAQSKALIGALNDSDNSLDTNLGLRPFPGYAAALKERIGQ